MNILETAAKAFETLLNINYEIVLGRKGKLYVINLSFKEEDFYHLAGLQYLTDIPKLKTSRNTIYNLIKDDENFRDSILNSNFFHKIKDRIEHLSRLENFLDSNETIFKIYQLHFSKINADYILVNESVPEKLYLFIKEVSGNEYVCNSFFPNKNTDYVANQLKTTLLFKKKIYLSHSENDIVFIDKITPPLS